MDYFRTFIEEEIEAPAAVDGGSLFAHTNLFAFCQSGILEKTTDESAIFVTTFML